MRVLAALAALLATACVQRDTRERQGPASAVTPWQTVVAEAKAFTLRIGFVPTANFTHTSTDLQDFPFCGRAPRLVLPYSYEDPAIEWRDDLTPVQCRSAAPAMDVHYGMSEALGEIASPVTPAMIASGVPRMVYLVVHEDCHDQFNLPYGIEEPLCEVISYRAMLAIAREPGPWTNEERKAIRDYAVVNAGRIPLNLRYYQQAAALYTRHARGELREDDLMREREAVFARAEASTGSPPGSINNVALANRMTYARHHAFVERVLERLGSDLGRLVSFFRQVDENRMAAERSDEGRAIEPAPAPDSTPLKSGPRQRALPLPRTAASVRSTGGAKPARPLARPAPRADAPFRAVAGDGGNPANAADVETPAALLARIQAAEAAVLDTAARLLPLR